MENSTIRDLLRKHLSAKLIQSLIDKGYAINTALNGKVRQTSQKLAVTIHSSKNNPKKRFQPDKRSAGASL